MNREDDITVKEARKFHPGNAPAGGKEERQPDRKWGVYSHSGLAEKEKK